MHAYKLAYVYMYVRMYVRTYIYQEHLYGSHTVLTVRGVPLLRTYVHTVCNSSSMYIILIVTVCM